MNQEQVETLAMEIEHFLDNEDLDYTVHVSAYDDGKIMVSVETWEVSEDPMGCASEIKDLVEGEFLSLFEDDTECYEMVMVTFTVDGYEAEEDDE